MSVDQEQFLDQVVSDLSQDDKVISVRLSLFAEMVKGKPWTPATLKEVQGTEGVRVMFLDETFIGPSANPKHRQHQKAARLVLRALVPETGTDIKGTMRPVDELRKVSGYADRDRDFSELMRILDRETRLITPAETIDEESLLPAKSDKCYQITHDYLVPTLRTWLMREQRKTRHGRAELLMTERSAAWKANRDKRHLPTWSETLKILSLTRNKDWTDSQRAMMWAASKRLAVGCLLILFIVFLISREMRGISQNYLVAQEDRITIESDRRVASSIIERLWQADFSQIPQIVEQLEPYRDNVDFLQMIFREPKDDEQKVRAGIALLKLDLYEGDLDILTDYLLSATPDKVSVLRDALLPHKDQLIDDFWEILEDPSSSYEHILPAASALAAYDPEPNNKKRWEGVEQKIVSSLLSVNALDLGLWVTNLHHGNTQVKIIQRRRSEPTL
jgi:hypothetical protein